MRIRDAGADEAPVIRDLATGDIDPEHVLRERTVRVAVVDGESVDAGSGADAVVGFLAFDARPSVMHLTRIGGSDDAVAVLLEDAMAVAESDGLVIEAVVPTDTAAAVALETKGFESVGRGPRFEGRDTRRFRLEQAG